MNQQSTRLLIVYNADGGVLNALMHAVHKAFRPSTYPCSLCAITYGAVSMHDEWRRFLKSLPMEVVFHHRDDFAETYPGHGVDLPAILLARGDSSLQVLISSSELDRIADTFELMELVEDRLVTESLRAPDLKIVA